jgi:periplasmic protein TonB
MAPSGLSRDRLRAGAGVALLHALLGYAFVTGLGQEVVRRSGDPLKLFDVAEPAPPEEEPPPASKASPREEGAASPRSLEAKPTPLVAPPPKILIPKPPPLPTVTKATPLPTGRDASAGSFDLPGPGTGAGGAGEGIGSGGQGSGTGGGGAARAQRVSGRIDNGDYPRSALRGGLEGSVSVRFTVDADGAVSDCRVTRSSGHAELDETTCRLIERRFRYRPARDYAGRPVPEVVSRTFDWLLPFRRAGRDAR